MMYFLYNILFFIFALFYLPLYAAKGKLKDGRARFGHVPPSVRESLEGRSVVWVHAVSVGEIGLAVSFANRLRERFPETKFVLTTTTAAGHQTAQKIKNEEDSLLYFPVDFPSCVKRFFKAVGPSMLVLFETEIWPNVIREASLRSVPVLIVNGRISDRAWPKYRRIRFFLKHVLGKVAGVSAQDERMRSRFTALGVPAARVSVTGNLKYDWEPSAAQEEAAAPLKRFLRSSASPLWIAGSTHEGEEEIVFRVYAELRKKYPELQLLIAPRHLNRLDSIEKAAIRSGVETERISPSSFPKTGGKAWLLDQIGVLGPLYESAQIVFIGGSLVPVGGHNPIEPAFYAKPVLFGPHMGNFFEMANEFKRKNAAVEVAEEAGLRDACERLLGDAKQRSAYGEAARRLVREHQGATQKNIDWVSSFMERSFVNV